MANSVKPLKEKQYGVTPRLLPRHTAASLARAALVATTRAGAAATRPRPIHPPGYVQKTKLQEQTQEIRDNDTSDQNDTDMSKLLEPTPDSKTPENLQNYENNGTPQCEVYVIDTSHQMAVKDAKNEPEIYSDNVLNVTAQENEKDDTREQNTLVELHSESSMVTKSECHQPCSDTMSLQSHPQTPQSTPRQVKGGTSRLPTKLYSSSTLLTGAQSIARPVAKAQSRSRTPNPKSSAKPSRHPAPRPSSATASRNAKSVIPIHQPVKRNTTPRVTPEKAEATPTEPKQVETKSMYRSKHIEYNNMKRDLDFRQQEILNLFTTMKELREQASEENPDDFSLQPAGELQLVNVADWTAEELYQLCRDAAADANIEGALQMIENVKTQDEFEMGDIKSSVLKIPSDFADFCLRVLATRQELVDRLKHILKSVDENSETKIDAAQIAECDSTGYQLCEDLRHLKEGADKTIDSLLELSGKSYQQRRILLAVGETLVREVAKLKYEVDKHSEQLNEMRVSQIEPAPAKERTQKSPAPTLSTGSEPQLRQLRARVQKLEKQLRDAEIANSSLTTNVRNLEEQNRQREVHFEARIRKMKEALKISENTNIQVVRERDLAQEQFHELSEKLSTMSKSHQAEIESLTGQIKELSKSLDGVREKLNVEMETKESLQESLTNAEHQVRELSIKVAHFESSTHNSDLPTEREINLRANLQATKDALQVAEEEINICKQEKVRFLETFTKISENESCNSVSSMQQKLASELATKEETVSQLQCKIRELKKAKELNEKKVFQYEQYVKELHQHTRAIISGKDNPNLLTYLELQEQVKTLRMTLMEAAVKHEELSDSLAQREVELDQQEKAVRAQAKTLKVREELINMLKNKETEQSRELTELQVDLEKRLKIVEEVNQQIAEKADEIQQLFATLEGKQQQIHRLEKIVVALEEQQRRAHAQRTRHEEKIATLEHELAAAHQRERKFLFF